MDTRFSIQTESATALSITGLDVSYNRRGSRVACVRDVSLAIAPGASLGLVGESGSGKSTIAMAIVRFLSRGGRIDSGQIRIGDVDVTNASARELRALRGRDVAVVYQDPGAALNPTLRIGRQVEEVYRDKLQCSPQDVRTAAIDALSRLRLTDPERVLRRFPHELSGGQKQRIVIAMALAGKPKLLILDEPTTGLDATVEAEVLDLVAAMAQENNTALLFISHNLGLVARMCSDVAVLYAGQVVETAPTSQLLSQPRHPYTAALLRCVPHFGMNRLENPLASIPGTPPSLSDIGPACSFADRCPAAEPACLNPVALEPRGDGRLVRCWKPGAEKAIASPPPRVEPRALSGKPLLTLQALQKSYRSDGHQVRAVDDVNLDINQGEIFGLVGESGSGKSSLGRVIVGLSPSTDGSTALDGTRLNPSLKRRTTHEVSALQMVFQQPDTALNPQRRVRNILVRAIAKLADNESAPSTDELAASVRLTEQHLASRPAALSGGLKQRVAIAQAFAGDPKLVVADEPVSALDVSVQAAILNLLDQLQRERGVSVLFISHDLAVVRYLADRIGVMYLGRIVDVGPAEAVFQAPHHPYTEALLSAIPPLPGSPARKRIRLEGSMPSPTNPPSGCPFHTRCPRFVDDDCATRAPPWQQAPDGNRYRCHIPPTALTAAQTADAS